MSSDPPSGSNGPPPKLTTGIDSRIRIASLAYPDITAFPHGAPVPRQSSLAPPTSQSGQDPGTLNIRSKPTSGSSKDSGGGPIRTQRSHDARAGPFSTSADANKVSQTVELEGDWDTLIKIGVPVFAGKMFRLGFAFFDERNPDHLAIAKASLNIANRAKGNVPVIDSSTLLNKRTTLALSVGLQRELFDFADGAARFGFFFYRVTQVEKLVAKFNIEVEDAIKFRVNTLTLTKENQAAFIADLRDKFNYSLPAGATPNLFAFMDGVKDDQGNPGRLNNELCKIVLFEYLYRKRDSLGRITEVFDFRPDKPEYPNLDGWSTVGFLVILAFLMSYSSGRFEEVVLDEAHFGAALKKISGLVAKARASSYGNAKLNNTHEMWYDWAKDVFRLATAALSRPGDPQAMSSLVSPLADDVDKVFGPCNECSINIGHVLKNFEAMSRNVRLGKRRQQDQLTVADSASTSAADSVPESSSVPTSEELTATSMRTHRFTPQTRFQAIFQPGSYPSALSDPPSASGHGGTVDLYLPSLGSMSQVMVNPFPYATSSSSPFSSGVPAGSTAPATITAPPASSTAISASANAQVPPPPASSSSSQQAAPLPPASSSSSQQAAPLLPASSSSSQQAAPVLPASSSSSQQAAPVLPASSSSSPQVAPPPPAWSSSQEPSNSGPSQSATSSPAVAPENDQMVVSSDESDKDATLDDEQGEDATLDDEQGEAARDPEDVERENMEYTQSLFLWDAYEARYG